MGNPFFLERISAFSLRLIPLPDPTLPPRPFLQLEKEKSKMLTKIPLSDTFSHNQLALILDVLGTPTIDEFHAITSKRSKDYIRSLP